MDAGTSTLPQTAFAATEPAKQFRDPFAEWRDCANHWDVSELWRTPSDAPASVPKSRKESASIGTEH
jgi:hypothetical protein